MWIQSYLIYYTLCQNCNTRGSYCSLYTVLSAFRVTQLSEQGFGVEFSPFSSTPTTLLQCNIGNMYLETRAFPPALTHYCLCHSLIGFPESSCLLPCASVTMYPERRAWTSGLKGKHINGKCPHPHQESFLLSYCIQTMGSFPHY